jgi:hypothetical protein
LNHEQHHFDISFISANLFLDKVKNATFNKLNPIELLNKLYKETLIFYHKMQVDYDGETMNGQLKDRQEKWNDFLEKKIFMLQ